MHERQTAQRQTQAHSSHHAGGILAGSTLAHPIIPRTVALLAAIILVVAALYMIRSSNQPEAGRRFNLVTDAAASHDTPRPQPPAESPTLSEAAAAAEPQQPKNSSSVTVNGKSIPVPEDGNLHKTITDGSSTTTIDLSQNASGSAVTTSTNISVESSGDTTPAAPDGD